jgi:F0F1-type ATP synthase membrane subunit b/b'
MIALALALLPLALGLGAEEAGHGRASLDFIGRVINFVVLFGGLFYFLRKPVKAYFDRRVRDAAASLGGAEEGRREAEGKFRQSQVRLTELAVEVQDVKRRAEEAAREEQERIFVAGIEEAARIQGLTAQEIDLQLKAGIKELKAFAIERAVVQAEARLRQRLRAEDQARLIDRSIERLAEIHEKPGPR